jgi:MYXO-CTERM domain-containing protein
MKIVVCALSVGAAAGGAAHAAVPVAQTYETELSENQDEVCIWLHPYHLASSTIITADNSTGNVIVYDLFGDPVHTAEMPRPGNIDIRHGVQIGEECMDLVVYNERELGIFVVYRVDIPSRVLVRVDDGSIAVGENYGSMLYRGAGGELLAFTGPEEGTVLQQYVLVDNGDGTVGGEATDWQFECTTIEGMVGDEEFGWVFLAETGRGIWRVNASDSSDATLIAEVGDLSGLALGVKGLALYRGLDGEGYLIASNQTNGDFIVYRRAPPHDLIGRFTIEGVSATDGIDVTNVGLGDVFPSGMLLVHNGETCCSVDAVHWSDVAEELGGLVVEPQGWTPRSEGCEPSLPPPDDTGDSGTGGTSEADETGDPSTTITGAGTTITIGLETLSGDESSFLPEPSASGDSGCACTAAQADPRWSVMGWMVVFGYARRSRQVRPAHSRNAR